MSETHTQATAPNHVVQPAEVSHELFLQHLTAMQQHYRGMGPTGAQSIRPYPLPDHLALMVPRPPTDTGNKPPIKRIVPNPGAPRPDEATERRAVMLTKLVAIGTPAPASHLIAEALDQQHQKTLAFVNAHSGAISQAIADAQGSKSTQTFIQRMDALRDRAKADHEARIDAMFASFTAIGTAHPSARPVILGTTNKVGVFAAGVVAEATSVAATAKSTVLAGGSAIGKAAEAVGKWASGAVKSVGHFFSGLF